MVEWSPGMPFSTSLLGHLTCSLTSPWALSLCVAWVLEQYGLYAFLIWLLSLAVIIVNLGVGERAKRFVAESLGQGRGAEAGTIKLALGMRQSGWA